MAGDRINHAKQRIRERVWDLLEREHVTEPGVRGYIPAFAGPGPPPAGQDTGMGSRPGDQVGARPSAAACAERALRDGKLVYMGVPRLAEDPPFYELDPGRMPAPPGEAASREAAARVAPRVGPGQMRLVDMVVCGSVMSRSLMAMSRPRAPPGKRCSRDMLLADHIRSGVIGDLLDGNGARRGGHPRVTVHQPHGNPNQATTCTARSCPAAARPTATGGPEPTPDCTYRKPGLGSGEARGERCIWDSPGRPASTSAHRPATSWLFLVRLSKCLGCHDPA